MTNEDKGVALVCSGLAGPGKAICVELLKRGWRVAVQDHGPETDTRAKQLAEQTNAGEQLAVFVGSLADEGRREELVEFCLEEFDRVDLLVCAAPAGSPFAPADLLELTPAMVASALSAGLMGPLFLAQRVANEMIRLLENDEIPDGKIVFLGGLAAYATSADQAMTSLASAGLAMLNRLFADRLSDHGINVYEVRAGLLAMEKSEPGYERYDELIRNGLAPLRRWGRPHDIALAVMAIADDLLGYSTGEVINVDGGYHLRRL